MEVRGKCADQLYKELWWNIKTSGIEEFSRNGPVISIPYPVVATLVNPLKRVLFNEKRDANPFFHIAEVVWMFAGSRDVSFIEKFNKRYREYADPGTDVVHAAYGNRWLAHFGQDQIVGVSKLLGKDHSTRRAVINMWDPRTDLGTSHNDLPCNTQIMFRVVEGSLDMLVANRSNDMVWGMMGANIVHFTYLHELVASIANLRLGMYRVVTNNLHVYPNMPRYEEIKNGGLHSDSLSSYYPGTFPLLDDGESWQDLRQDCETYVRSMSDDRIYLTQWFRRVALPMMECYLAGRDKPQHRLFLLEGVDAEDWKLAGEEWIARRAG